MSIVIFCQSCSFPQGNAATNRVHTYAKGFTELGIRVHVVVFGNFYEPKGTGVINGIHYYHAFGQTKRSKYFLVRRWQKAVKYLNAWRLVRVINRKDKVAVINGWVGQIFIEFFLLVLSRSIDAKMIIELNEHPLRKYHGGILKRQLGRIVVRLKAILCDGMFCISQYLVDFYKARNVPAKKLFLVPGTVDTQRFQRDTPTPFEFPYIAYCGSLTISKDGVNFLVEGFYKIKDMLPQLKLVLIGKGDTAEEENRIRELVNELAIGDRVVFLGQKPRESVPSYLLHASILALARPKSIVADAGFPSKLTEYLATGVPVVVTRVGDIPFYLEDRKTAFLCEPDSVDAFAGKLREVLSDDAFAKKVGLKGKELTQTIFNYHYQAQRMLDYIHSL